MYAYVWLRLCVRVCVCVYEHVCIHIYIQRAQNIVVSSATRHEPLIHGAHCNTLHCSILQHNATHPAAHRNTFCNTLQHIASPDTNHSYMGHTATHCNTCTSAYCHTPHHTRQHAATRCNTGPELRIHETHCNTLQHTVLWHTAKHRNTRCNICNTHQP